jgi:hypothetical protein
MKLKTFSGNEKGAAFFILNKGERAGMPRFTPWCAGNCFAVFTDERETDFAKCYMLFAAGLYRPLLIGSVIPFIRKSTLLDVLAMAPEEVSRKELQTLFHIDELIEVEARRHEHLKKYRAAFARHLIRKGGATC